MFIIEQTLIAYDRAMPNIGVPEIGILVAVLAVIAIAVVLVVTAAARAGRTSVTHMSTGGPLPPHDLESALRTLIADGKQIHAIKLLRQHTGLGLKSAKDAVEAMAAGRDHPALARLRPPAPALARPDLATRVRELKAAGRTEQAVHLVIGETGMSLGDAETFVRTL